MLVHGQQSREIRVGLELFKATQPRSIALLDRHASTAVVGCEAGCSDRVIFIVQVVVALQVVVSVSPQQPNTALCTFNIYSKEKRR